MQKLISFSEAKKIDITTQTVNCIPSAVLMERAGMLCAQILHSRIQDTQTYKKTRILVCCGSGNNGGDGLVVARELYNWGYNVSVLLVASPKTEEATLQLKIIESLPIVITDTPFEDELQSLNSDDWIVDALIGIAARSPYRNGDIIEQINASLASVFSIDMPSGVLEDKEHIQHTAKGEKIVCVRADITACIGLEKIALFQVQQRKHCGDIVLLEDVFPLKIRDEAQAQAYRFERNDLSNMIPEIEQDVYKYTRGVLVIDGGSKRSPGALVLSVKAASKSFAGLIYAMIDEDIKDFVAGQISEAVSGVSLDEIRHLHTMLVGSGWGKRSFDALAVYLRQSFMYGIPCILDADALRLIAAAPTKFFDMRDKYINTMNDSNEILNAGVKEIAPCVFTPHLGELEALYQAIIIDNNEDDHISWWQKAQKVADYYQVIVCAKHAISYICMPHAPPIIIEGNNPVLALAGSGDVLAGLIGSISSFVHVSMKESPIESIHARQIRDKIEWFFRGYIAYGYNNFHVSLLYSVVLGVLMHIEAGKNAQADTKASDIFSIISHIPKCII